MRTVAGHALATLIASATLLFSTPILASDAAQRQSREVIKSSYQQTHLAIAMGGAVSLGSFEAGILAEMTRRLEAHNRSGESPRYVIDVLAGASAGSMSLAMMANELYDPSWDVASPEYADTCVYFQAWVTKIKALGLIRGDREVKLHDDPFIFDENDLYTISNESLKSTLKLKRDIKDYKSKLIESADHPATEPPLLPGNRGNTRLSLAPETMAIGMTLSAMEGLTRGVSFQGSGQTMLLEQPFFDDRRRFVLNGYGRRLSLMLGTGLDVNWNDVALTSIASGAFPFAFEPVRLRRHRSEYEYPPREFDNGTEFHTYTYVDGGFFDNDPLQLARSMATEVDRSTQEGPAGLYQPNRERLFIYLAPQVAVTTTEKAVAETYVDDIKTYGNRIAKMAVTTARSQGYRRYIDENDNNHARVRELAREIRALSDSTEVEDMLRALVFMGSAGVESHNIPLLRRLADYARDELPRQPRYWDGLPAEVKRRVDLRQDWGSDLDIANWLRDEAPSAHRQLYVQLFELRDLTATNNFVLITSGNGDQLRPLGRHWFSFGGFFNKKIRAFDYMLGRYYAQKTLRNDLGLTFTDTITAAEIHEAREPFAQLDQSGALALHFDPDSGERVQFRDAAEDRLRAYVKHAGVPRLARGTAYSMGNRWLDNQIYHYPRSLLLRGNVGWDKWRSSSLAFDVDVRPALAKPPLLGWFFGWLWSEDAYDQSFRGPDGNPRSVWAQLFVTNEWGHWQPNDWWYLDTGLALHVHWRVASWIAPRFVVDMGVRSRHDHDVKFDWNSARYSGVGVDIGALHLGLRHQGENAFDFSSPSIFRVGFSVVPRTVARSLAAYF